MYHADLEEYVVWDGGIDLRSDQILECRESAPGDGYPDARGDGAGCEEVLDRLQLVLTAQDAIPRPVVALGVVGIAKVGSRTKRVERETVGGVLSV